MAKIFVTIYEETVARAIEAIESVEVASADGLEIRVDRFDPRASRDFDLVSIRASSDLPMIYTRRTSEGLTGLDEDEFRSAVTSGFDLVDVELDEGRESELLKIEPGRTILSHHDFDSIVLNSETRDLTRRLIRLYSDHCQEWQERADGQIGRKLPGIVSRSAFNDPVTETVTLVDLDMNAGTYARDRLNGIAEAASREGIDSIELSSWLAHFEDLDSKRQFYFSIQWTWVKATK